MNRLEARNESEFSPIEPETIDVTDLRDAAVSAERIAARLRQTPGQLVLAFCENESKADELAAHLPRDLRPYVQYLWVLDHEA